MSDSAYYAPSFTVTVERIQRAMNRASCNHYMGYRGVAATKLTVPILSGSRVLTWHGEVRLLTRTVRRRKFEGRSSSPGA
jgi:hypothetical protein